jgi:putative ABC transport system substrate-binding protein
MSSHVQRRSFLTLLGGAAAAWPVAARAQQPAMPVVGVLNLGSPEASAGRVAAFRKGLGETGYVEGRNVAIEFHWAHNDRDRLPELVADLVRRQVAVIAAPGMGSALTAKALTTTIPIVFSTAGDPVQAGLVASLNRPGGNVTGISSMAAELVAKQLGLLHELLPRAARFAALVNPATLFAESIIVDVQAGASTIGRQVEVLTASTSHNIDTAFASLVERRADALLVSPDLFFGSRRVQIVTLASYRPHPQRREARRPAGDAADQVRLRHQPADRPHARHRRAANATRNRRRGDRMIEGASKSWRDPPVKVRPR